MKVYKTPLMRIHRTLAFAGSAAGTALGLHLSVLLPLSEGIEMVICFCAIGAALGLFVATALRALGLR